MDKLVTSPGALRAEDYEIISGQQVNAVGRYIGDLRIRRKTDGRIIYPFDGCTVPGPFDSAHEARRAARELADELVRLDIACPEQ